MNKLVDINRVALWKPIRSSEISIRTYTNAYPYMNKGGILGHGSVANPVYRYAKNFTKHKLDFALFIFSTESDVKKIQDYFDSVVEKLKKKDISETLVKASMSNFAYIDYYKGEK